MKDEKEKNIRALTIAAIIAVIVIVGGLLYNYFIKDDGANASDKYLIVGNYLILQKTNTSFKQIKEASKKVLQNKFVINDGNNVKNDVTLQFLDNKWYFFDNNFKEIQMPNFRVATHNLKVKLAKFERKIVVNFSNDKYINKFLEDNNVKNVDSYTADAISCDLDNDGKVEYIYTLSNYTLSTTNYKQKGYSFIVKDNTIYDLTEKNIDVPYTVMEILDLNIDDKYEIIINRGDVNLKTFDSCYKIYGVSGDKIELQKDCK